jgi:hypothetical protein
MYLCIYLIGIDPDELNILDIRRILETLSIKEENHEKCITNTRNNLKDFSYLLIERLEEEVEENNESLNEKNENTDFEITDFIPALKVIELDNREKDDFNGVLIGDILSHTRKLPTLLITDPIIGVYMLYMCTCAFICYLHMHIHMYV